MALLLAACSGQSVNTSDSSSTSAPGTSVPGTTPRGTTVVIVCNETVLEVLVAEEIPGSALDDVTCGPPGTNQAVATIIKEGTPDQVGFFVGADDGWSLAAHAAVTAEADKTVPKDFSMSLYRTWRDKYDLRTKPAVTTARTRTSKAPGTSTPSGGAWCTRVGDKAVCKDPRPSTTTTTAPKPTTTTTRPTTTAPPVTVTTAPAPRPPSAFCLANPFDPRCAADPSFPG